MTHHLRKLTRWLRSRVTFQALPDSEAISRSGQLQLEDLAKLLPEDRLHICEWLTEKVDALCAQLKPNSKEVRRGQGEGSKDGALAVCQPGGVLGSGTARGPAGDATKRLASAGCYGKRCVAADLTRSFSAPFCFGAVCSWVTNPCSCGLCPWMQEDEDDHDDMGDIDLWCLSSEDRLMVNPRSVLSREQG